MVRKFLSASENIPPTYPILLGTDFPPAFTLFLYPLPYYRNISPKVTMVETFVTFDTIVVLLHTDVSFKSGDRSLNLQLGWNSIIVPGLVDTFPFNVYNNRNHTDFHLRVTFAKYEWNRLYIPKISSRYSKKKHPNVRILLHILIEYAHFFIYL